MGLAGRGGRVGDRPVVRSYGACPLHAGMPDAHAGSHKRPCHGYHRCMPPARSAVTVVKRPGGRVGEVTRPN